MRNMNCQNVRREIDEAAPGEALSVAVSAHLKASGACETLSREQSKLQAIISTLETVEAPGDFDFRLRARLAGERNGTPRPFGLSDFSFGFRSAAVALVLLVIGAAFVFVSFRTPTGKPVTGEGAEAVSKPVTPPAGADAIAGRDGVKPKDQQLAQTPKVGQTDGVAGGSSSRDQVTPKRRFGNVQTQESGLTQAKVFKANNEALDSYPTAAFPIDASYQSVKVSVDDGRGSSRTISLPAVSFGSQRALSQNLSPSMVPTRGDW